MTHGSNPYQRPSVMPQSSKCLATTESSLVSKRQEYVVGIDLGGTKVTTALAGLDGVIVSESTVPTHQDGGTALVEQIAGIVEQLCRTVNVTADQVATTAIGGPGAPGEDGTLLLAPNLGHSEDYNLAAALGRRLGHSIVLENDVNAAAMGEVRHGHGRFSDSFVFIAVGTGIGMGIVVDGSLVRGSHGAAGEIGYLPFGADPLDVANHFRGPLEEVTSGAHISAEYLQLTGIRATSPEVFTAAAAGNPHARAVLDDEARNVARAIVAVAAVLDPDMFILGGGIGSRPEMLPLIRKWTSRFGHPDLMVHTSQLRDRAAVVGAVEIAIQTAHAAARKEQSA